VIKPQAATSDKHGILSSCTYPRRCEQGPRHMGDERHRPKPRHRDVRGRSGPQEHHGRSCPSVLWTAHAVCIVHITAQVSPPL
jgi:hypothetical protein